MFTAPSPSFGTLTSAVVLTGIVTCMANAPASRCQAAATVPDCVFTSASTSVNPPTKFGRIAIVR